MDALRVTANPPMILTAPVPGFCPGYVVAFAQADHVEVVEFQVLLDHVPVFVQLPVARD